MSQRQNKTPFRNYARLEVERMPWPDHVDDPQGDERRRLQSEMHRWRAWAVVSLVTNVVLFFLLLGDAR